ALLMFSRGYSICEAALEINRSCNTIYRWLRLYREKGISFIETRMTSDRKELMWKERTTRVIDILHAPPNAYDINRTSWTYDTIAQAYYKVYKDHLPKGALKRIIKEAKYTWQHARKVLTSNDPDYKKKIAKILSTLRNVNKDEAFFFVDELGPYKVKAYGGKSLTPKGLTKIIPKHPQAKEEVQAIAALEAFTNQMTWEFTENKNSETIVMMLDKLWRKYAGKTKLYITWDGISSHRSTHIQEWVNDINSKTAKTGSGPAIEIVPLPSSAQFLNVIESVFGGMKKAVIQNSDYASKNEMQAAMDRHFAERNLFYEKNPKRAGNKIWDEQAFAIEELPGGLFKKM
ncbi:MAG: IS630 family transposase, partial [Desulfobulbaceae bacterium]|nr:IS630 family transposase [Desulfobulbaceae bacterium]